MRSEWDDPHLVEPWVKAMGEHGDYWRQTLINPLVLSLAGRLARGDSPFAGSMFQPLLAALPGAPPAAPDALAGVEVLDLGCGEGCLGRLLAAQGARYLGLDSSEALLAVARQAGQAAGPLLSFARAELEGAAPPALAAVERASLVTAAVVLDHMAEIDGFLAAVGAWLARQPGEIPVLCITLAPERFEASSPAAGAATPAAVLRPGERAQSRRAVIESCQREVTVWLRPRRVYERCFRDAGLFVRRCEPLFFHRRHTGAPPEQRDDASRRPVFWAWLLSARRGVPVSGGTPDWPGDSDAAALHASVDLAPRGPGPAAPRIYDFRPGEPIIRVHNMGGELYAVLAGAAKMMDSGQELMTFRAGEVLGDLETPDASGQCGSFPFDVVASDQGCRVALFGEATASAVLAGSREFGSRLFRLLRDRLRLALWHYDIREIVGEYLEVGQNNSERLEKRLLHRCARALLWAAAIEGRGRARALGHELAFIDPETIARRFKPGTERIDFGVVVRQLHLLRMIDAFPGATLRKEEEGCAGSSWDALVARVTTRHLLGGGAQLSETAQAAIRAHAARLRVAGQLTKDGNRTRQFQEVVEDLAGCLARVPDGRARLERWSGYIARAHRFWEDRNPWLIVLRDVPALRRIALSDAAGIKDTIADRAEYLLTDTRRPTWELLTAQAAPARRAEYIAVVDAFLFADLAGDGRLGFSSEGAG